MDDTETGSCGKNLRGNSEGAFEGEWLHWMATSIATIKPDKVKCSPCDWSCDWRAIQPMVLCP